MIVVADTSPLNYLIQIDKDHVLPALYESVLVPSAVIQELSHPKAPVAVAVWLSNIPSWIRMGRPTISIPELSFLDLGERQATELAEERLAHLPLIDEREGARVARGRGFDSIGTLGILLDAGKMGLLDPEEEYRFLRAQTTFRVSLKVEAGFLQSARSR